jgi:hypothetical protein
MSCRFDKHYARGTSVGLVSPPPAPLELWKNDPARLALLLPGSVYLMTTRKIVFTLKHDATTTLKRATGEKGFSSLFFFPSPFHVSQSLSCVLGDFLPQRFIP